MFTEQFDRFVCAGESISCEVEGFTIKARIVDDDTNRTPWEDDGHGPVSDWTTREKRPGERTLSQDRGSRRFYDFAEAVKRARADGWDAPPFGTGTAGERAARAAELDFKMLKAWCDDEWHYVGVVLSVWRADVCLAKHAASLWGIEANYPHTEAERANEYLQEVANELLPEAMDEARKVFAKLCGCAESVP